MTDRTFNVIDLIETGGSGGGGALYDPRVPHAVRHFGFREAPFADSVNPAFFFRTEAHEDTFLKMRRCVDEHIAIGLTTAPSGTGKTLLTRILISELDPRTTEAILILAYPGMKQVGFVREMAVELGITGLGPRAMLHEIMGAIQDTIVDLHRAGRKLVIIIDECHFLEFEALQMIRTLSNIEVPERKLVTLLLFGEESFLAKADRPEFASIFNRMFVRARLRPLTGEEAGEYIRFRCLISGGRPDLFPDAFVAEVHRRSRGIPREINRLCHHALCEGARLGRTLLGPELLPEDGER